LNLSYRFVETTGTLTEREARLIQQGAFGIDLTGNVVLDVTLDVGTKPSETDVFLFNLVDDANQPRPPADVKFQRQVVRFVPPAECRAIQATSTLSTVMRMAQLGDSTIIEGDDEAVYATVTNPAEKFELVPKEALRFSVWWLVDAANQPLHMARVAGGPAEVVQFADFDHAVDFLTYIANQGNPASVGGRALTLNNAPLTQALAKTLQVEIQKLNWQTKGCV
jgi:hypothetical protein